MGILKALFAALAVALVVTTIGLGIYAGAMSFTVPIPKAERQDCLDAAYNAGKVRPQCPARETVWERGLRDPVAQYTLWITWFTGVLTVLGLAQWALAYRQIELARAEFRAVHRPTLEVRFVREVPEGIEITVINTGTGPARFIAARAEIRNVAFGAKLPSPNEISARADFDLLGEFEPSQSYTHTIQAPNGPGQAFEDTFGGTKHVFGWIIYETVGPNPVTRTTYFGRRVDLLQPELIPVEGSDWNFIQ